MKIEMRWLPVGIWDGRPYVKVDECFPCVLQLRYLTEQNDDSGKYTGWTEWEDVEIGR